ncbi:MULTISPECIES: DeoR/GlpR family DNA-binding transcription regulator [Virgibacillus]|uniref:HTH-type transcriptional repressor GlcR n=2 Tax=Virgibacillus TaxID=84406 RepID=A0A024QGI2_9BACI|nr:MULTISPECIES: DeoR/GlpR family DNA-binding transcription regulator [Virgibacillus]EQB38921.1 hypothetical protein M948_00830 [Virgibacillus sp. CM-4]MYL43286.1 DeoR family transcriptional regulator [Virgibacillus massiliensis]GGJ67172.1 DeoR family transcriptional regulator [Virgibacillus kapii]CDQ41046.1 HTH-type transcriptional repressor GlcR [Virgibacillus massiliensis]
MLAAERKLKIIEYVKHKETASVAELSSTFQVHEATIRRDLNEIEKEGKLRRTHGGVVLVEDVSSEPTFTIRASERIDEKQRIAKQAASMVDEGDNIILDSGTTTYQIAQELTNKVNITIVTNDINIAAEFKACASIKVIVTGGILFPDSYILNGVYTDSVLNNLYVSKAFVAIPAFHPKRGLTHFDEQLISAKKSMIEAAEETIVVTDHTKLGGVSLHTVSPIDRINKLITGKEASEAQIQQFRDAGLTVYTV